MKQGRWFGAWFLLLCGSLFFPSFVLADPVPVAFHWTASPLVDDEGQPCAEAVGYRVYVETDHGPLELTDTVHDTLYTLMAEVGVNYRLQVVGFDSQGRLGPASDFSSDFVINQPQSPPMEEIVPPIPTLRPNFPNPFNPSTTLRYAVPADYQAGAAVSLEIFSLRGQRVRALPVTPAPGTWTEVEWDGTDDSGRTLPSGQYVARFICGDQAQTTKMTMLK